MNEEQKWAIEGWIQVLGWLEDRWQSRSVDEALEELFTPETDFSSAPEWLVDGVRQRLRLDKWGKVEIIPNEQES